MTLAAAGLPFAVDALAAVCVVALAVLTRPDGAGAAVWVVAALVGLPLAARRRWPEPALAVVVLAAGAALLVGVRVEAAVYPVAYVLYPVALGPPRRAAWALAAALTGVLTPGL